MRIAAAFILFFLGGVAGAEAAPLKRLTLRQDLLGFEAVGRVDLGDEGYCTGVLIVPDLVLTAAHCLFEAGSGAPRDPGMIRFRAGLRDGMAVGQSSVARAVPHPAYIPAAATDLDQIRRDVALLELATPIPVSAAAPFQVRTLASGASDIGVVSFARGRDAALSWQDGCKVLERNRGVLAFDCDVYFGSSGAPVFDRSGGRPSVVAIISGGTQAGGRVVSFGMDLIGPVAELRAALRSGCGVWAAGGGATSAPGRIAPGTRAKGGASFVRP